MSIIPEKKLTVPEFNEVEQEASVINRLKSPPESDLSRKRKVKTNPSKGVKGATSSKSQKVSFSSRIKEFPSQHLSIHKGKLFCNACREYLSLKKSVISLHINMVRE